jgi:predicted flap endonuclease-1-like 5' DNA nuclease
MTIPVGQIRGISDAARDGLTAKGIDDSAKLVDACTTPQARRDLAASVGIDTKELLEYANRADLARIKGVAGVYGDLLEEAGVDTVRELAQRVPANLHKKLEEVNAEKQVAKAMPQLASVEDWVAQAKELPVKLTY